MKLSLFYLFLAIAVASCSTRISKEEVRDSLLGYNYWLTDSNGDTLKLEFLEGCARNFDWRGTIVEDWEVLDTGGTVLLNFNGSLFEPRQVGAGEFEFLDAKRGEKLSLADSLVRFDENLLWGEWVDARHANLKKGEQPRPVVAKCSNLPSDSFLIPGIILKGDSCILRSFCYQTTVYCNVNEGFGAITFDQNCAQSDQWIIKKLTKTELIVDMRYREHGKQKLEFNKLYLKVEHQ